jgi:hypothetical protein
MQLKQILTATPLGLISIALLAFNVWCAISIYNHAKERAEIKDDYSYVNSIDFGLLSVTAWRDDIQFILLQKVDEFYLTPAQEEEIKAEISKVLNALIDETIAMIEQQKTFGGKLRKAAVNTLIDWDKLRQHVPEFSETILNEIKSPDSKENMGELLKDKINEYAAITHDSNSDSIRLKNTMAKYESINLPDFNAKVSASINTLQEKTYMLTFLMLGSMIIFLLLWFLIFKHTALRQPFFILSVVLALVVLIVSLTSPMIEIDARIQKVDFVLLGEHIEFSDQVLFYQSKSIIDVVHILLGTGKADSILVGILILAFSVLFPITKLISTDVYLLGGEKLKQNKFIRFFAFKSGKWAMVDVTVVAIFMAYVGFKGILDDQLESLNVKTESYTTIATNLTSLQPGFMLFVAFVIFSLVLSEILKKITSVVQDNY